MPENHEGQHSDSDEPIEQSEFEALMEEAARVRLALEEKEAEQLGDVEEAYARLESDRFRISPSAFPDHIQVGKNKYKVLNTAENLSYMCKKLGLVTSQNLMSMELDVLQVRTGKPYGCAEQTVSMLKGNCERVDLPDSAVDKHLKSLCLNNPKHPVKDWLDAGGEWDGTPRVERVVRSIPTDDVEFAAQVFRSWLIGCVASLYEKRFNSKLVPILQGDESCRKTAWISRFSSVVHGAFAEGIKIDMDNKDSIWKAIKRWIVELGEMDATTKSEQSELKSFITMDEDSIRLPYDKGITIKPRQTNFIGTVNPEDFMRDAMGKSRYAVIRVTDVIDMDAVNEILGWSWNGGRLKQTDSEQLRQFWLEVREWYANGESWNLPDCIAEKSKKKAAEHSWKAELYQVLHERFVDPEEEDKKGKEQRWMRLAAIVESANRGNYVNSLQKFNQAMTQLKKDGVVEHKRGRANSTWYLVWVDKDFKEGEGGGGF